MVPYAPIVARRPAAMPRSAPAAIACGNPDCRKDYTVTTKTVMEKSHIPLNQWLLAFHLAAASKKGFSAHQLHRTLNITYKSAWFLFHRVREAMRTGGLDISPMAGDNSIVEMDETYFSGKVQHPTNLRADGTPFRRNLRTRRAKGKYSGPANKRPIISLVERGGPLFPCAARGSRNRSANHL